MRVIHRWKETIIHALEKGRPLPEAIMRANTTQAAYMQARRLDADFRERADAALASRGRDLTLKY